MLLSSMVSSQFIDASIVQMVEANTTKHMIINSIETIRPLGVLSKSEKSFSGKYENRNSKQ